jgi:hypothetical protein
VERAAGRHRVEARHRSVDLREALDRRAIDGIEPIRPTV